MTIEQHRRELMEAVNEAGKITLSIGKKKYAARIAGCKLDYPFIWARHEDGHDIEAQLNWHQVELMKQGSLVNIIR